MLRLSDPIGVLRGRGRGLWSLRWENLSVSDVLVTSVWPEWAGQPYVSMAGTVKKHAGVCSQRQRKLHSNRCVFAGELSRVGFINPLEITPTPGG